MKDKEKIKIMDKISKNIKREIESLVYNDPKCDFEHAWNCALDKAAECCDGYGD